MDAPQPQKERGQPAGRPPTTGPRALSVATSLACEITRCPRRYCSLGYEANPARRTCEPEKSQGIVTLHSGDWTEGRAFEVLNEIATKKVAKSTNLRIQNSILRSLP
jgi:hypothetical protein